MSLSCAAYDLPASLLPSFPPQAEGFPAAAPVFAARAPPIIGRQGSGDRLVDYLCVILSCARGTLSVCKHKIHQTCHRYLEVCQS